MEGDGRYSDADAVHFFVIARASARETRYWLERAVVRRLIPVAAADEQIAALTSATQLLNRLIATRRRSLRASKVREPQPFYQADGEDPSIDRLNA